MTLRELMVNYVLAAMNEKPSDFANYAPFYVGVSNAVICSLWQINRQLRKMRAAELKAMFDNVGKNMLAMGRFNELIDWLLANDADVQEGEILACLQEIEAKLAEINEALAQSKATQEAAEELLEETQSAAAEVTAAAAALRALLDVYAPAGTIVNVYAAGETESPYAKFKMGADEDMCHRVELPGIGSWRISYAYGATKYTTELEITGLGVTQIALAPTLEASPWAFIDKVSQAGLAASCWAVGDIKTVFDGTQSNAVRILGFDHDLLSEPGKGHGKRAGISFGLVQTLEGTAKLHSTTTVTEWAAKDIVTTTLPEKMTLLNSDLQAVIKTVNKVFLHPDTEGSSINGGSAKYGGEMLPVELFLLSDREIFGEGRLSSPYYSFEEQYEYYRRGGEFTQSVNYWLRSHPYTAASSGKYGIVLKTDGVEIYCSQTDEYALLYGFCV